MKLLQLAKISMALSVLISSAFAEETLGVSSGRNMDQ
jgi:hypothetical protein